MKIFVAGATGVVGWRAVRDLVSAGHAVTGVARSPEKAALLRSLGAVPVTVDLFDPAAVEDAVAGHDVVCNLATHIPHLSRSARPAAWEENNRIRHDVSKNLVDAALAADARRYIQESIAFIYGDRGPSWIAEDTPFGSHPAVDAVRAAEEQAARFTRAGGVGVVLRFGMFYGDDSSQSRTAIRAAQFGIAPGFGGGFQSMVHLDDAGSAVAAALSAPPGTYNVVEDRPMTRAEQAAAIGDALGIDPPQVLPAGIARAASKMAAFMTWSQRVSNRKFRETTGWTPCYPDQWTGWTQVAASSETASPRRGFHLLVIAALASLSASAAVTGFWAAVAPHSFYQSFPAIGHWVEGYRPYNEHLVRDVGELNLAMLVLTGAASVSRRRSLVRLTGLAWLVDGVPHFLFHLLNHRRMSAGDQIGSLSALGFAIVLAVICVIGAANPQPSQTTADQTTEKDQPGATVPA